MHSKQSSERVWKQTFLVDKKQLQSFSKDVPKLFTSTIVSTISQKLSKVQTESEQAQLKIKKEEALTFNRLGDVLQDVEGLRNVLKFYDQSNEYLVKVQNSSESIMGKLDQFRGKMGSAYETLADEEDTLNEELQFLSKKIEAMGRGEDYQDQKENIKSNNRQLKVWERNHHSPNSKPPMKQVQTVGDNRVANCDQQLKQVSKEIERIDKEVTLLGKHLNWPEQDHKDFKSIWTRSTSSNKTYFKIEEDLQGYFTFYTPEEIQEHMNKYIRELKLIEKKKECIVEYKNIKETRKMAELEILDLQRDEGRELREKEERKRKGEKQQAQKKVELGEWQERKARERIEQEELKAQQDYDRKCKETMKKRQSQHRNNELLSQWKQEQAEKKQQQIQRVKSSRKHIPIDHQAGERIRAREDQLIQKKLELLDDKRREQFNLRQKEAKIKESKFVKYSYVDSKLESKTTAMKEKQREKFDGKDRKEANTFGGQLMMTGIRATPSWMK